MSQSMEERAREWIKANAPGLCFDDGSIGADDLESLASLLREVRREALELAAKDACMYCGGRALGYRPKATGPNAAGNWEHASVHDLELQPAATLCRSSAIHARLRSLISSEEAR